jgi:hypothetical protein
MTDRVFDFTNTESELSCTIFPAIIVKTGRTFSVALHSIATYNSIPNIGENNCKTLHFTDREAVKLETGTYELSQYIKKHI